ncbi:MAG: hypothetical protein ACRDAM_16000 [Casimicrobium sp.]
MNTVALTDIQTIVGIVDPQPVTHIVLHTRTIEFCRTVVCPNDGTVVGTERRSVALPTGAYSKLFKLGLRAGFAFQSAP